MKFKKQWTLSILLALVLVLGVSMPAVLAEDNGASTAAAAGKVTVSVEKFTLGKGYLITPTQVSFTSGETVADVVTRLMGEGNYTHSGSDSSFYLSRVKDESIVKGKGNDNSLVPQYIRDALTKDQVGLTDKCKKDNMLGEFDFTNTAGWTVEQNNTWLQQGMGATPIQDGDVIRLAFTLYGYGADWAQPSGMGENALRDYANLDTITKDLAQAKADGKTDLPEYQSAVAVASDLTSTQTAVDAADKALMDAMNPVQKVTGITLDKTSIDLKTGTTEQLTATVAPENATDKSVTWSSDNPAAATVDTNGVVTAVAPGKATITATANDGSGISASCVVTVTANAYTLHATAGDNGTIDPSGDVKVDEGKDQSFTLQPNDGYVVDQVTVDGTAVAATNNVITISDVQADHAIAVTFKKADTDQTPIVRYEVHGQNYGWDQGYQQNGKTAGTTGQGLRIEAFKAQITDENGQAIDGLGITYDAHCANIGWQKNWASDNTIAGTTGQARQVEAIRMKLTGSKADDYDIYYRVHAENFGWMNWAKNGEDATFAGTNGYNFRIEAIQIALVKKGDAAPTPDPANNSERASSVAENVTFSAHIQNYGWSQGDQKSNQMTVGTAGTTGEGLRVEALKVKDADANLNFIYRAHVENEGWQPWKTEGQLAGTTGKGLRVEAFELKTTGTDAEKYDVYYRAHVENLGWTSWVKDGATAGTTGQGLRVEALQIKVVEK
jgi:uncharacterized protein YjdB